MQRARVPDEPTITQRGVALCAVLSQFGLGSSSDFTQRAGRQRPRPHSLPPNTITNQEDSPAARDSKLSFVGRAAFEAFGRLRPELYRYLTTFLATRQRDTNDALAATSFLSIKGRLARTLLRLAETFGRDVGQGRILIRQKVSQADLAAMAGVARENVNRVLHDWAGRSLVSRLAGYYCLDNQVVLKREAED